MSTITDWLMVGITGIYVIATIFICVFNGRSAKATREQIAESKRQFEETKRLEYMPCFEIHFDQIEAGTGTSIELTDKQALKVSTINRFSPDEIILDKLDKIKSKMI